MVWRTPPQPEKAVQAQIVQALRALGCHVSATSQTRPSRQALGLPDLWVMHPGWRLYCWIEVKRPSLGRLSPAQRAWHAIARDAGVPLLTASSVREVLRFLQHLGAPICVPPAPGGVRGGTESR